MDRPRNPDEGRRSITRCEQRKYAEQLRSSLYKDNMASEAGAAFAHYLRTDASGARPIPERLLALWIERGWIESVSVPDWWSGLPTVPGVVLDPFLGTGTSIIAALRLGRRAVGLELSEAYCNLSRARITADDPHVAQQPAPAVEQAALWGAEWDGWRRIARRAGTSGEYEA